MQQLNYLKSIGHPLLDKILRKGSSMFVPCGSTECYIRLLRYTRMFSFIVMLYDRWLYTGRDNCNYFIRQSWRVAKILCSFKITIMDILQRSSRKGKFNVEEVNLYELQKDYVFASTILSSTNFIGKIWSELGNFEKIYVKQSSMNCIVCSSYGRGCLYVNFTLIELTYLVAPKSLDRCNCFI